MKTFQIITIVLLCAALQFCAQGAFADETEDQSQGACSADRDCDGVADEEELRLGTDPDVCDTDEDGLSDGVETGHIQPEDINGCHGLQAVGANYKKPHAMDPLNPDSDGDGLNDGEEDVNANGWVDFEEPDPTIEDTDSDGVSDYVETTGDFDGDKTAEFDFRLIRAGQKCTPPETVSDLDCDEIPNARDNDSDNDGCEDNFEDGFVDANANGIPDLYDNQEKSACPDVSSSGGGGGGKKTTPEEKKEEPDLFSPFSADGTDGTACTLMPSKNGRAPHDGATPVFFAVFLAMAVNIPFIRLFSCFFKKPL